MQYIKTEVEDTVVYSPKFVSPMKTRNVESRNKIIGFLSLAVIFGFLLYFISEHGKKMYSV